MYITPEKSFERSIDSLQRIYAVILALSIGQSITKVLIDRDTGQIIPLFITTESSQVINWNLISAIPAFIAFIVTVVVFHHGMNRHFDKCYLETNNKKLKGALLFDFFVFFIEAGIFFAFASSIRSGLASFIILGVLLIVDSIWALVSNWIHYSGEKVSVVRWAAINFIFIVVGILVAGLNVYDNSTKAWVLMVLVIARTVADYVFSWDFYFPTNSDGEKPVTNG
jgi:hypothetical protein